jgi:hypothetical protein
MSAECDIHGIDLVYSHDWPEMECPVCKAEENREGLIQLILGARLLISAALAKVYEPNKLFDYLATTEHLEAKR